MENKIETYRDKVNKLTHTKILLSNAIVGSPNYEGLITKYLKIKAELRELENSVPTYTGTPNNYKSLDQFKKELEDKGFTDKDKNNRTWNVLNGWKKIDKNKDYQPVAYLLFIIGALVFITTLVKIILYL